MLDKLLRACSLGAAVILSAAWAGFGWRAAHIEHGRIAAPGRAFAEPAYYHSASGPDMPVGSESSTCSSCHGGYPHKRTVFTRAFLNLHLERLGCMVCHLEAKEKRKTGLGWFISGPDGVKEGSRKDMRAVLMPYVEDGGERIVLGSRLGSRSGGAYAGISADGKHLVRFETPSCAACHSSEGLKKFQAAGYDRDDLEKLDKLEYIASFTEGRSFYYPRF